MTDTLSGAHPFNPQHLIDAYVESADPTMTRDDAVYWVAELLGQVGEGRCLRCGAAFAAGEIPSGSRVTDCRCVPVCRVCSEAEAYQWDALVRIKGPEDAGLLPLVAPVTSWPVSPSQTAKGVALFRERYTTAAYVELSEIDVDASPSTGGWIEHGYDDTADREERER